MEKIKYIKVMDSRIKSYYTKQEYIKLATENYEHLQKEHNDTRKKFVVWINKKTKICNLTSIGNTNSYVKVLIELDGFNEVEYKF